MTYDINKDVIHSLKTIYYIIMYDLEPIVQSLDKSRFVSIIISQLNTVVKFVFVFISGIQKTTHPIESSNRGAAHALLY